LRDGQRWAIPRSMEWTHLPLPPEIWAATLGAAQALSFVQGNGYGTPPGLSFGPVDGPGRGPMDFTAAPEDGYV
jgi:hypothetical protein